MPALISFRKVWSTYDGGFYVSLDFVFYINYGQIFKNILSSLFNMVTNKVKIILRLQFIPFSLSLKYDK